MVNGAVVVLARSRGSPANAAVTVTAPGGWSTTSVQAALPATSVVESQCCDPSVNATAAPATGALVGPARRVADRAAPVRGAAGSSPVATTLSTGFAAIVARSARPAPTRKSTILVSRSRIAGSADTSVGAGLAVVLASALACKNAAVVWCRSGLVQASPIPLRSASSWAGLPTVGQLSRSSVRPSLSPSWPTTGRPLRTGNTYRPGCVLLRLPCTSPVSRLVSRNAPGTPDPGSSKKVPGSAVPFENPTRAAAPPRQALSPPLACPASHWIWL